MSDYEHKEYRSRFYGASISNLLFGKYPNDMKPSDRKTGRMRKALRKSIMFKHDRMNAVRMNAYLFQLPALKIEGSRHARRKQSRGFVSNRKSGDEGVRVEWKTLNDTKDK